MIVMFGSRGCARDAWWLLHETRPLEADRLAAFVAADGATEIGSNIRDVRIVGEADFLREHADQPMAAYIGVGAPSLKRNVHEQCRNALAQAHYPSLIHPSVRFDRRDGATQFGMGIMICAGTTLTTEVVIGDFVHVNLHCTIAHCARIDAYATLSPGCHVSGGVHIGAGCFLGAGAVIAENVRIAPGAVIGAGATVVKHIDVPGTFVGTPARLMTR